MEFEFRRGRTTKTIHEYVEEVLTKYQVKFGGVAQLGEHLPCKQGVDSSILFISTNRLAANGDWNGHRHGLIAQVVRAHA